jgi:flagellar motor protein MotB
MSGDQDEPSFNEVPREKTEGEFDDFGKAEGNEEEKSHPISGDRRLFNRGRTPYQIWLVSYSDFMTILTIFFLAMYGYTYLDAASLLFQKKEIITYSAFSDLVQKLQGEVGDQLKVQDEVDKVTIELGEKILFASGSEKLTSHANRTLLDLAESLKLVNGDVIVQGHTDNVPIVGGQFRSNWELSAARAFSVIEALTEKGVPAERLAAWGFGENRPRAPNNSAQHRAQNRRIEIVVLKTEKAS